jgi:hypothetical protein
MVENNQTNLILFPQMSQGMVVYRVTAIPITKSMIQSFLDSTFLGYLGVINYFRGNFPSKSETEIIHKFNKPIALYCQVKKSEIEWKPYLRNLSKRQINIQEKTQKIILRSCPFGIQMHLLRKAGFGLKKGKKVGGAGLEPATSTTQFYLLCDPTFLADL